MRNSCFKCGKKGTKMYGYYVCDHCLPKVKMFTDKTIEKYLNTKPGFEEEIQERLDYVEEEYIMKTIKLKYIQDRIQLIKKKLDEDSLIYS